MKEIPLTKGKVALVDDEDYEQLSKYKWYTARGYKTFYAVRKERGKTKGRKNICMHREIMGVLCQSFLAEQVDHLNGNGLDNRRENLRVATVSQNRCNRGMTRANKTGYKGVKLSKNGKRYQAWIDGCYLATFDTPEMAARRYDEEVVKRYGEFAQTNFKEVDDVSVSGN